MNKICYISDFFLSDIIGGGELNDDELCKQLIKSGNKLKKIKSHEAKLANLSTEHFYIISNFVNLSYEVKEFIQNNCAYVIYEHDHKYLLSRNPAIYKNFKAPLEHIVNKDFYKKSRLVFCQSSFHENIFKNNTGLKNSYNISGNLWSKESLDLMRKLGTKQKSDCYSILDSKVYHKNTRETIFYCKQKKYNYRLIKSENYFKFLDTLSDSNKFIFLPKTPETLSRIVVEARMMNIKVVTNGHVGAVHETWFNMKGEDLILLMENKRQELVQKILEIIND